MSFKQLEHAKKLVKLKNSSVVKVLAVNQFGLEQLEMVSLKPNSEDDLIKN